VRGKRTTGSTVRWKSILTKELFSSFAASALVDSSKMLLASDTRFTLQRSQFIAFRTKSASDGFPNRARLSVSQRIWTMGIVVT
jgi:hypothetical protein